MGFFGKLVKGVLDTAILPVEVVKDVVTGDVIFEDETDTEKRVKKIKKDIEDAGEDAGKGDWL